ncbi:MAG: tryptophan synthase subunit alpha, partial [Natronomonas sp.]
DGVIVGSALVDIVAAGVAAEDSTDVVAERLEAKARELKQGALDGANRRPRPERT